MPQPPEILTSRGRCALSEFRLNKLRDALSERGVKVAGLSADYWHFIGAERPLTVDENVVLERVLTYGPAAEATQHRGRLFVVTPRPGTVSPWSSKATDIARCCGLSM